MRPAARITIAASLAIATLAALPTARAANRPPRPHVLTTLDGLEPTVAADAPPVDTNTECGPPAKDPVPDGEPIVVTIPPGPAFTVGQIPASWWKTPPYGDGGWQLQLRGFIWLHPLARRAAIDGQKESLNALVEQVHAFHAQNPDPGTGTQAALDNANAWGWDEGTALRRLGAENCLYSLTKDPRLVPGMKADVAVQFGPRFYGPPNKRTVHNHGVMADLAVIKAADLLGRKDWRDASIARLVKGAPMAWSPAGINVEQSASYDSFNVTLWDWVVDTLRSHLGADNPDAAKVAALVGKAQDALPWITDPDGNLAFYGDTVTQPGARQPTWTGRAFRDDVGGVAVGRWSWTDPATSYYLLRYGPKRWGHGQQDRGGVTWSTAGRRVLVNPGKPTYDPAGNYRAWGTSPAAHNVATLDRATFTDAPVYMTSTTQKAAWHTWNLRDALYGVTHDRQVSVLRDVRTLVVKDTYAGNAPFHQWWHLHPDWAFLSQSADGKTLTFKIGTDTLTVTTTGVASTLRGVTRPVGGWHFPDGVTRLKAWQITVTGKGTATTTFRVS